MKTEEDVKKELSVRNKFIAGLAIAGVGAAVALSGGDKEKPIEPQTQHETEMETEIAETETEAKDYSLIEDILKEYNEKNPEIEITMDDVGILKEEYSQYVFEEDGIYKENYRTTNGNKLIDVNSAQDIYTLLDKQNQKVICAVGNIEFELSYVEVQETRPGDNIPYYGDAEEMVWVEQEDLEQLQQECEELLQEKIQEQEEKEQEDDAR